MENEKFTSYDLKLAENFGEIKGMLQGINKTLSEYCNDNKQQHEAMWKKIDKHSRLINYILGVVAVVGFAIGVAKDWLRVKILGA